MVAITFENNGKNISKNIVKLNLKQNINLYCIIIWSIYVESKHIFDKPADDDTWVDHSDVTATSSKLPYKTAFPLNKCIKKKLWSARFFRFVYLFCHRHVI